MKTIRRKRITIREKEVVISRTATPMDDHFCPVCHAPIQPHEIPGRILTDNATGDDKLLSDKY